MKTMTAKELHQAIALNPAWATTLTEPVAITEYCNLSNTLITHLSPLLHFNGKTGLGHSAWFKFCPDLKIAEGNFAGFVDFSSSSIEQIGQLQIQPNTQGDAAAFDRCSQLKKAEGNFSGRVSFEYSGITTSKDLVVTGPNNNGIAANFRHCENLIAAEGTFNGMVGYHSAGISQIGKLIITGNHGDILADFEDCKNLRHLPIEWLGEEILCDSSLRERSTK